MILQSFSSSFCFSVLFLREAIHEPFRHGQRRPVFDTVCPAFPLPATASHYQGAPENSLGEAVVARDMAEPCKFPSHWPLPEEVPVDP